ncbi:MULTISPECIES: DUF1028 domain-containing protein [Caldilinea]|jgi:uncharacterized Ntn-hydrolase superfamily protein|uniref:DUF1028 domain-containing protein n=1 Tax=Caldilinea aerophila (strain DSM 14535 / JCM 11387 / NBRC 104270 / STL-6-O1) TaxID=926550 RepID=I0I1M4_CALAS|nr:MULTISPECIES: DUF1028 domain-containing protein [Caldilinea]BAL99161.1 hypothetical protein CLDAP_11220 [Caldilinea aerophila DSM 14535 = NBRC 104270]GIV74248.1 MAG: pilus assembly protein [Caldilinea sp.]
MTFSIVAWDEATGQTGVAVSTKFLAVGSLCPFAKAGVGAVATQAFVNPTFGPRGLRLLEEGVAPEDVIAILLKSDDGREHRQLHLVDRYGRTAAFTGSETVEWAGHKTFPYFSVAGNMLSNAQVIEAMAEAYQASMDQPLAERLIRALEAGQLAGGDKRGRQSAALYIMSTEVYPMLDLRVDDHPDPVAELRRIYEEAKKEFIPFQQFLPTAAKPAGIYDRAIIDRIIAQQAENDRLRR